MNGTAHMAIGATVGFLTANTLQTDPTTTLFLVGIGGSFRADARYGY
ncbi:hypothetical protein RCO48_31350 [Peribacillus frigoritolerans]|nr:hypothetical protein [Peribacillus frigoritolerans]